MSATSGIVCFLGGLASTSLHVSLLIGLILLVRAVFGKTLSARWRYALWCLVCIRILVPWGPVSSLSLDTWIPGLRPIPVVQSDAVPVIPLTAKPAASVELTTDAAVTSPTPLPETEATDVNRHVGDRSLMHVALLVGWLVGAGTLVTHILYHHRVLIKKVARDHDLRARVVMELLEDCKTRLGVVTPVRCIATDAVAGPVLLGWIRPRLLIPRPLLQSITRRHLRHIFLHELTHLKRHDIAAGWIVALCQVIHWFNPLVWLAFYLMRADREMACDHTALSSLAPGQSRQYGLTLLHLLEQCNSHRSLVALAGIAPDHVQLRRRVRSIGCFQPRVHGIDVGPACLLALLAVIGLTRAKPAVTMYSQTPARPTAAEIAEVEPVAGDAHVIPAVPADAAILTDADPAGETSVSLPGAGASDVTMSGELLVEPQEPEPLHHVPEVNPDELMISFHRRMDRSPGGTLTYSVNMEYTWGQQGDSYFQSSWGASQEPPTLWQLFSSLTHNELTWLVFRGSHRPASSATERHLSHLGQLFKALEEALVGPGRPMRYVKSEGGESFTSHGFPVPQLAGSLSRLLRDSSEITQVQTCVKRLSQLSEQARDACQHHDPAATQRLVRQILEEWEYLLELMGDPVSGSLPRWPGGLSKNYQ